MSPFCYVPESNLRIPKFNELFCPSFYSKLSTIFGDAIFKSTLSVCTFLFIASRDIGFYAATFLPQIGVHGIRAKSLYNTAVLYYSIVRCEQYAFTRPQTCAAILYTSNHRN